MSSPSVRLGPVERDAELATLAGHVDDALSGRGVVVGVLAPAGMGKSTLLDAFARNVPPGVQVLRATGQELEHDLPYVTIRHLLEPALADQEVRRQVLRGAAAPVGGWFAPAEAVAPVPTLTMLRALYWTVVGLAERGPLVLVVDDVPEADPASVQFLAHLCQGMSGLRVLVVLAGRPDAWRARPAVAALAAQLDSSVPLAPLTVQGTACLVERRLGMPGEPEFVTACRELTGGNPFYLGELLREVAAIGAPPTAASVAWVADLGVPALVRGSLFRVASLPPGTLDLLRAAAVLQDGAALNTCARVAGLEPLSAGSIADRLAEAGILAPGTGIGFAHAILRSAVLADLRDHERAGWHRRAAEVAHELGHPDHVVARHLIRSEPLHEQWAADVLAREGRALLAAGAAAPAAELLGAALAERPEDADADLLADLGTAQAWSGNAAGADQLERAVAATTDPEDRAARALRLTLLHARQGRNGDAIRVLDQVMATVAPDSEPALLAAALRFLYGRYAPSLHDQAVASRCRLEALVQGEPTPGRAALRVVLASDASHHLPREEAVALIAPVAGAPLIAVAALDSQPVFVALEALLTLELDELFDDLVEQMVADSLRRGSAVDLVTCEHFRALAAHLRGLPEDAVEEAQASLMSGSWSGWPVGASASHALLGLGALECGRTDEAAEALDRADDLSAGVGKPGALVHLGRGRLHQAAGEHQAALACFLEAGELLRPTHSLAPGLLDWAGSAVVAGLATGHRAAAVELAEQQLSLARVVAGPRALARSLRSVAACHGDEDALIEALGLLEAAGDQGLERVRTLADLGALQRRGGRPAVARRHLREAWDLAQRIGAVWSAEAIRDELRVAGGRPRRGYVFGPDALTAGERRVAELAAAGRSNVEIAQVLFVTTKTVEKHLGSCYRKLGVASRRELPDALG